MNRYPCTMIYKESDVIKARKLGRDIAKKNDFRLVDEARFVTAISELCRNMYIHAGGGSVCFELIDLPNNKGISIVAIDTGPGIIDIKEAMKDGYSSSGSLGAGLPSIKRLMDTLEVESTAGKGTTVTAFYSMRSL